MFVLIVQPLSNVIHAQCTLYVKISQGKRQTLCTVNTVHVQFTVLLTHTCIKQRNNLYSMSFLDKTILLFFTCCKLLFNKFTQCPYVITKFFLSISHNYNRYPAIYMLIHPKSCKQLHNHSTVFPWPAAVKCFSLTIC